MENTIAHRIRAVIDHYGLNKNSFSRRLGMPSNATIVRIANDYYKGVSYEVLYKIGATFPEVDMNWLILGAGEITKSKTLNTEVYNIKYMGEGGEVKDTLHITGYRDCDTAYDDIIGGSMSPVFNAGDIILCRRSSWESVILGEPYRIVTKNDIKLRYVIAANVGRLVLHAESARFPDIDIPVEDITDLFAIKGLIRRLAK